MIIPAHNEESTIARLLDQLIDEVQPFDVIVVCNGCTDATADIARAAADAVVGPSTITVIDRAAPSKREALLAGHDAATVDTRVFVDADVEIDAASICELILAFDSTILATGPVRTIPRSGVAALVRWYYDVWERLPQVRAGLFGRGVVAVSPLGLERIRNLPDVMGDDLVLSEAFLAAERRIVDAAQVTVHGPKTVSDLYRRRVRAATGNVQADEVGLRQPESVTSIGSLVRLARREPRLIPRLPVFVAVTVAARLGANRAVRAGDFTTWRRDESSRRSSRS